MHVAAGADRILPGYRCSQKPRNRDGRYGLDYHGREPSKIERGTVHVPFACRTYVPS